MATLFWFVFLTSNEITMAGSNGWAGFFIVVGYILALVWDGVAIDNMVN